MSIDSTVPGTNVPPISFPGILSGIDYNAIIQKLTSLTLAQNVVLNQQIATLNAANNELIKIQNLFQNVQTSLQTLSSPLLFNTFDGVSSNPAFGTAQGIPNVTATPGTYLITNQQLATGTQITSNRAAGHSMFDLEGGTPSWQLPLDNSYAQIQPQNGPTGSFITIDGVKISYDVSVDSLQTVLAKINTAVDVVDPGFLATFVAGTDTVQLTSSDQPISLGSPADQGNLEQVLRLDTAQVFNSVNGGSITGTSGVGGIDPSATLNAANAGFVLTPVSGTLTINGVNISYDVTSQNLYDVINAINQSSAGVVAAFNTSTGLITLSNKNTGPQAITLSDTGNLLQAAGLTTASGAVTNLGTQASVTVQGPTGVPQTVYSNSNQVTNAIPG
ncbi:MAG: hypothetical protein JOZ38_04350, partial [Candidatus Eremiobacteraeota bacterium]|nr:hypothetical protein [Candidatus Eremiobacteraeota bacterium]